MKEIVFYPSKKKSSIIVLISILLSILAIYILGLETVFHKDWWIALGIFIFFCITSITILYKTLIKPMPSLILNENGIEAHKCPFIEWNNVRDIKIKNIKLRGTRSVFLCILPYSLNRALPKH